jgi:uroporphyrinogen decarboxylase
LIIDFGGNPLSGMEGKSMSKLLDFLGYSNPCSSGILPFGRARKMDERILNYFDIDTRSVGAILTPEDSQAEKISEVEQIDEWGIRRKFTGMYWDIVGSPLKGATVDDLEKYKWPIADTVKLSEIESYAL